MALLAFEKFQQRRQEVYERDWLAPVLAIKRQMEAETGVEMPTTMPSEGGTTATLVLIEPAGSGSRPSTATKTSNSTDSTDRSAPSDLGRVHVACVGDSRAVLGKVLGTVGNSAGGILSGGGILSNISSEVRGVPLSTDHNVESSEEEVARAVGRGGAVCGKYMAVGHMDGMLQVLRSLGDCGMHQNDIVTALPELTRHPPSRRSPHRCERRPVGGIY
jgi:hypothetical protein